MTDLERMYLTQSYANELARLAHHKKEEFLQKKWEELTDYLAKQYEEPPKN